MLMEIRNELLVYKMAGYNRILGRCNRYWILDMGMNYEILNVPQQPDKD